MEIGKKIQALRESRNLTQEELAELMGVSTRQLQRLESGESEPKQRHLHNAAKALKVEIIDLVEPTFRGQPVGRREKSIMSHGSAAFAMDPQSSLVAKFLSARPDIHLLVLAILDEDPTLLDELSPDFVEQLKALLSGL